MGLPGLVALMAINNARAVSVSSRPRPAKPNSGISRGPNSYGSKYREQIIHSAIRRARPLPLIGWLDICPLDEATDVLGIDYPRNDAYQLLCVYHCVGYFGIPKEIRRRIPELIREALSK